MEGTAGVRHLVFASARSGSDAAQQPGGVARIQLTNDDHVVIVAIGNAAATAEVLLLHVYLAVVVSPKRVYDRPCEG